MEATNGTKLEVLPKIRATFLKRNQLKCTLLSSTPSQWAQCLHDLLWIHMAHTVFCSMVPFTQGIGSVSWYTPQAKAFEGFNVAPCRTVSFFFCAFEPSLPIILLRNRPEVHQMWTYALQISMWLPFAPGILRDSNVFFFFFSERSRPTLRKFYRHWVYETGQ